jgi:hypothetical protein
MLSFQWSSSGPIQGKSCIQIIEPSDPHTWQDNYLCPSILDADVHRKSDGIDVQLAPTYSAVKDRMYQYYQLSVDNICLKEQRDRREDLYLNVNLVDGSGRLSSFTTPVWSNLDEEVRYDLNYQVYAGRDPHGFLEVSASMFDEEGKTAAFVADFLRVGGPIISFAADYVVPGSSQLVGHAAKIGSYVADTLGELGDDDFYGQGALTWSSRYSFPTGSQCLTMNFYEPDTGYLDRGHDIDVVFRLDPLNGSSPVRCPSRCGGTHWVSGGTGTTSDDGKLLRQF